MLTIPKSVGFRKCGSLCAFVILAFVSGSSLWWYQNILLRSRKPSEIPSVRIICPTRDIITAHKHGRLGNLVWTYASTVAIGHFLNFSPYLPSALLSELEKVFQDLSVPAYEETILSAQCRRLYAGDPVRCLTGITGPTEENISPWNILCRKVKKGTAISDQVAIKPVGELKEMRDRGLFGDVLMLPLYIIHTQAISVYGADRFRELFRFRPEILDLARKTIHGVLSVADERVKAGEVSFVGVHVRRTDYSNHIKNVFDKNATVVNAEYYQRAMRKMTDEYNVGKTVLFMVVSDDRKWCLENLVDEKNRVFWAGMDGSPYHNTSKKVDGETMRNHDLALMALLNDSIISYGSFGTTGALLAGGRTIAFKVNHTISKRKRTLENDPLANYLENWSLMD